MRMKDINNGYKNPLKHDIEAILRRYIVRMDGTVFSIKHQKNIAISKDKKGYSNVYLRYNGKYFSWLLHRLVAFIHLPNIKNKPTVNHINGIKSDNNVFNLEWATYSEQEWHKYHVLGYKYALEGRKWTIEQRLARSKAYTGSGNPNWKGGKNNE